VERDFGVKAEGGHPWAEVLGCFEVKAGGGTHEKGFWGALG